MHSIAATADPLTLFAPAAAQRALVAVLLLAVVAAAVGWAIVLLDLAFFTHAAGAGSYPLLVAGAIVGASVALSALVGAITFAVLLGAATASAQMRSSDSGRSELLTGLAVAAALALGALLAATDAGARSGVEPEGLLFGDFSAIDGGALAVLAAVTVAVLFAAWFAGERWLAGGFDSGPGPHTGTRPVGVVLPLAVAAAVGGALPITGSLLAGALLVIPAATVRIFGGRARRMPPGIFALAAAEGVAGLYLALALDLPAGAAIAAVAGAAFFVCSAVLTLKSSVSLRAPALLVLAVLLPALVLVGCGGASQGTANGNTDQPLSVVATTAQVADIVRHVGGQSVSVTTLVGPGTDPQKYRPSASDNAALKGAGAIFRSGGAVDDWLPAAARDAGVQFAPVDLARSVLLLSGPDRESFNPHWYLDPQNVARAAQRVRDELVKAAPDTRETFRANATQYLNQIDAARARLATTAAKIPQNRRTMIDPSGEFAYLADAFGLRVAAAHSRAASGASAVLADADDASSGERAIAKKLGIPLLRLRSERLGSGRDASNLIDAIGYDLAVIAAAAAPGRVTSPLAE